MLSGKIKDALKENQRKSENGTLIVEAQQTCMAIHLKCEHSLQFLDMQDAKDSSSSMQEDLFRWLRIISVLYLIANVIVT